ncbi:MAG: hypothetical protein WAO02_11200 [Verrucomicrobiia bacterium]
MKPRLANLRSNIACILAVIGIISAGPPACADNAGQKAVEETRQSLRQQGFKTDLADFDFSMSAEMRAREAMLKATAPTNRFSLPFVNHPNLMEAVGTNSAIVVWQQAMLKTPHPSWPDNNDELTWEEFREAINANQPQIDAARAAVLSGPVRFHLVPGYGNAMRLPHLALLKNLTQTLRGRTVIALHEGNLDAAWTNLMAATRLVTAWEPEPVEISHLVRFGDTSLAFSAVWQALQTNGWTDEQLTRLQQEWESVNFFTNLPETAAFKRASNLAACQSDRQEALKSRPPFKEFVIGALQFPLSVYAQLQYRWSQREYLRYGIYEDEIDLLLFYRDRELELRNAVQAPTWAQMRQLPGVTNYIRFQSKYRSRFQTMMNLREMNLAFQRQGPGFLGRAATAETQRRLIVTAIALERYRGRYGSYPKTLPEIAPEFLKNPPIDFMDGQPLRYRLTEDGHFLLYSVGLDGVDHGGKLRKGMRDPGWDPGFERPKHPGAPVAESDLVWPLPASIATAQDLRRQEARTGELHNYREQQRESEDEWKQSPLRQSRVAQILATNWWPVLDDGFFGGRPAAEFLRNTASTSNRLSLAGLMTPRQVLTGNEPEDLTFEFPVRYDAITNHGFFLLLDADMDPGSMFAPDSGAKNQECSRAPNGDCLLVWHTIYDPPGQHALQVELTWYNANGAETWCRGPAISVVTSNLCQFSLDSSTYDIELGATFHARLPEKKGSYSIECVTTNGAHLATLAGSTSNGEFNVVWNLVDDHGHRLNGETFNSIVRITLPDSGRSQTLKGP